MRAIIKEVKYNKEFEGKFGIMHIWYVKYNDKFASIMTKSKDKPPFEVGKEAEFTETEQQKNGKTYYNLKKIKTNFAGGYNKAVKREQSKYAGFAASYTKDLIIADKLNIKQWKSATEDIFNFMVQLDKKLES